jgi:diguanylate cyclase (GGDEF)-like protein
MQQPLSDPTAGQLAQEVLAMLDLRESSAVPHWAAARLIALCGANGSKVLRVFPIAAARTPGKRSAGYAIALDSHDMKGPPSPIGADAGLVAAIGGARLVSEPAEAGRRRLLVPLSAAGAVRYVVEVAGATLDGAGGALADALLPVVASYYDLLADAETDPLTRLANRRVFYSEVGAGLSHWADGGARRFLAMTDIDHFKQVNDRFGHLYGDEILIHFARLMRDTFRAGDMLYRFGGEEFVIVFTVSRAEDGQAALERFRGAVESYPFPRVGRITASVGFTSIDDPLVPVTTLIDRADNAVYYAKRNGRNRVCNYESLIASGALKSLEATVGGEATLF